MVRAGLFNDVDAVVSWHPGDRNEASPTSSTANITGKFRFRGVAAHAAAAPDRGPVGARRRRGDGLHGEHDARARAAGDAHPLHHHPRRRRAQRRARFRRGLLLRAASPNMRILDGVWERIVNAANGAALGTGTTMELEVTGAVYNVLPNDVSERRDAQEPRARRRLHVHAGGSEVRGGAAQDAHRSAGRRRSDRRKRSGRCAPAPSTARPPTWRT